MELLEVHELVLFTRMIFVTLINYDILIQEIKVKKKKNEDQWM